MNFNENSDFIVEYLIELVDYKFKDVDSLNKHIFQFLLIQDIQSMILKGNPIKSDDGKVTFNIHSTINNINTNMEQNQNNILTDKQNNNNENDIINMSIISQSIDNETNSIHSIKQTKKDNTRQKNYLIDKEFYSTISQKILNVGNIDNNQDDNLNIKKYSITPNEDNSDYKLSKIQLKFGELTLNDNKILYFPINFTIINQTSVDKIKNVFLNKNINNVFERIYQMKIEGGIILIPKINNFKNSFDNLIYIYSNKEKTFEPRAILECKSNTCDERNEIYDSIKKNPHLRNTLLQNLDGLGTEFNCICHIIKDNNIEKTIIKTNSQFNISDKLKVLILLIISQNNFENNKSHEVYLVNPEWLKLYRYESIKILIKEKYKEMPNIKDLESVSTILKI